jgi:hypothetical protein
MLARLFSHVRCHGQNAIPGRNLQRQQVVASLARPAVMVRSLLIDHNTVSGNTCVLYAPSRGMVLQVAVPLSNDHFRGNDNMHCREAVTASAARNCRVATVCAHVAWASEGPARCGGQSAADPPPTGG